MIMINGKQESGVIAVDQNYNPTSEHAQSGKALNGALTDYAEKESYSTEEVKTNSTWIDGKPIYRKCYSITSVSQMPTLESLNIASMIAIKGVVYSNAYQIQINSHWDSAFNVTAIYDVSPKKLIFAIGGSVGMTKMEIVLEYTKTTN